MEWRLHAPSVLPVRSRSQLLHNGDFALGRKHALSHTTGGIRRLHRIGTLPDGGRSVARGRSSVELQ
jgi:hypothetical protein